MADYIPSRDNDALVWFKTLDAFCQVQGVVNGLTAGEVAQFTTDVDTFDTAIADEQAAYNAWLALVQVKKVARATCETSARFFRRKMDVNLDDAERAAAGFTVPDSTPTPSSLPISRPVAQIDTSKPLQHTINFADQGTPTSKAKPAGVTHAEVWVKVGDPAPTSNAQCTFAGIDPKTPMIKTFDGADANKQAHYLLRWISSTGQPGPWSELHSATITSV